MKTFITFAVLLFATSVAAAQTATLTWQDNSTDETGFSIERKLGTAAYVEVTKVTANTKTYVDSTVPVGPVCYRVYAFNATGKSTASNEACATVPTPPTVPIAPSGAAVTVAVSVSVVVNPAADAAPVEKKNE